MDFQNKKVEIVNLTPHKLNLFKESGEEIVIPSSGFARVSSSFVKYGTVNGIVFGQTKYGIIEGLPPKKENVIYIVSAIVKARCPERHDVFAVSMYRRDENNNIIGADALSY